IKIPFESRIPVPILIKKNIVINAITKEIKYNISVYRNDLKKLLLSTIKSLNVADPDVSTNLK
ncbi:hypothetical protein NE452_17745, partial [Paeniclostridium sordellii]|nr:hypothetical protein [Paeniclostridium sordellii]